MPLRHPVLACLIGLVLAVSPLAGHPASTELTAAARAFLDSLDPAQRQRVTYPLADAERENWHYVPRDRNGLRLKDLTPGQRDRAIALLHAGLSERGRAQAEAIMSLEQVLFEIEGRSHRDAGLYTVTLFGEPSEQASWGWRVEGHHLSVNFTLVGGHAIATTPSFFGANPAEVRSGPRQGLRALGELEDLGRELVRALTPAQQQRAILPIKVPSDILTTNQRRIALSAPEGLAASAMNAAQRKVLEQIVRAYVFRHRPDVAQQELERITAAGWETVHFAWVGGLEPGVGHYYRVQGRTFLIEYDNTQNNANHVHAVWRDAERDFGRDLLREHYERDPHGADAAATPRAAPGAWPSASVLAPK